MSLAQKLILYALAVALLPLAAAGFTLVQLGEEALRGRIAEHQRTAAAAVAAKLEQAVGEVGQRFATALQLVDPLGLNERERQAVMGILMRQSKDAVAVVLVDGAGAHLTTPVGRKGSVDAPAAARLVSGLPPLAEGLSAYDVVMSPAYFFGQGAARVALAIPCCTGADKRPRARAGVELQLGADVMQIAGIDTGPASRLFVVDAFGRVITHPELPPGSELSQHGAVKQALAEKRAGSARYAESGGDGGMRLAAFAPVGGLGWTVVVEQPEEVAFAAAAAMRRRTLTWMAAATAIVLVTSLVFAGRVRRRLGVLVAGARAFGQKQLSQRLEERAGDEIGELAKTMNGMAGELEQALRELEEWNKTLEQKVDERTRELKEAQAQLLVQSKLAAIGQLGAGVAHEVNNPLAGILGYAQLLLRKHPPEDGEHAALKKIEEAAQRCRTVTTGLLRFSQRGLTGRAVLSPAQLAGEVLDILQGGLEDAGIKIVRELDPSAPEITADAGQLSIVLINIVSNAKNAMAQGGTLTVKTRALGEDAAIDVCDTGAGIDPEHLPRIFEPFFTTKKVWSGVGLGLSVAYRVVTDHGGRIDVDSKLGHGTRVTVVLPRVPPPAAAEPLVRERDAVLLK